MIIRVRHDRQKSNAPDLDLYDRHWADMISAMQNLPVHETEKRIRRIRLDEKLNEQFKKLQTEFGSTTVITNLEWGGPEMKDIVCSVAPPPAIIEEGKPTPTIDHERALTEMRRQVAAIELQRIFPRTGRGSLPGLIAGGVVQLNVLITASHRRASYEVR